MDILAHTLWTGAGLALARHRWPQPARTVVLTLGLAALPDLLHLLPIAAWWAFGDGSWAALHDYAVAQPGHEPPLPPLVLLLSHHLHCIPHSAIVAAAVGALVWALRHALWVPLLGWWLHIVVDVFSHSAAYYPVPVLYPITDRGFDGWAWNRPTFQLLNYGALAAVGLWIVLRRRR